MKALLEVAHAAITQVNTLLTQESMGCKCFLEVIRNKEISLKDRWELFSEAPNEWSVNKKDDSPHLRSLDSRHDFIELPRKENWPHVFCGYGKIDTVELVEELEQFVKTKGEHVILDYTIPWEYLWKPGALDAVKEEILSLNLKSFRLDQ